MTEPTARGEQKKFPLGMRVRLNEEGKKSTHVLQNRSGVVTGYSRDGHDVYVLWDDHRSPQPWACFLLIPDPR